MEEQGILLKEGIFLNLESVSRDEALKRAGTELCNLGYTSDKYSDFILMREEQLSTFVGNYVAIPHGTIESKTEIYKTGIIMLQYPGGIDFGDGNTAYILIGVAANENEHIEIISKIATLIMDEEEVLKLKEINDAEEIYQKIVLSISK